MRTLTSGRVRVSRSRLIICVAALLLALYLLPMVILQEGAHFVIHDNLDSTVPNLVFADRHPGPDADNGLGEPFLRLGVKPAGYARFLSVVSLLFALLPPFAAYLVNDILVHGIAFIGMLLLLRRLLRKELRDWLDETLVAGVALCWAMLPYYSTYGLSIAGQPLLFFAFLNVLRRESRYWDYAIIFLFPLYSSLALSGVFIIGALGLVFVAEWVRRRRANWRFLVSVALLALGYLVVNHRLVYDSLAGAGYVSHRAEFVATLLPLADALRLVRENLVHGQYHAGSLHKYILVFAVPLALVGGLRGRRNVRWLLALVGALAAISVFRGFTQWDGSAWLPRVFQFDRFYFLQPAIWYVVLALCLLLVRQTRLGDRRDGRYAAVVLLVLQLFFVTRGNKDRMSDLASIGRRIAGREDTSVTYGGFYSEELFRRIADFIGQPQSSYRVVSLGMYPGVSQYNGFYTLDGYRSSYPLAYKYAFRRVIAAELDKSPRLKDYFDNWGSRCYLFSSELEGYLYTKSRRGRVYDLELNTAMLREMGGEYLLSAVRVMNHRAIGLELLRVFEDDTSPWRIYLYMVHGAWPEGVPVGQQPPTPPGFRPPGLLPFR